MNNGGGYHDSEKKRVYRYLKIMCHVRQEEIEFYVTMRHFLSGQTAVA